MGGPTASETKEARPGFSVRAFCAVQGLAKPSFYSWRRDRSAAFMSLLRPGASGQPATPLGQPTIEAIVKGSAKDDYGLRSLVHGIVQSETFRSK
ncbi:MAG: DUF1585 domain-containing protein [Planctomycetes bacterium]|nr:DUF1585 domain-containing protein [Planctomycetota bacterium]